MLATMSKFQTVLTPIYDINKKRDNKKITNLFYKGCDFIESLNVPVTFCNITRKILIGGKYFGILRDQGDSILIQDLPASYCRTRFKDYNGLNILEFNLRYFDSITDEDFKKEALKTFPVEVQRAYTKKTKGKLTDYWIEIPPSIGGACFTYGDGIMIIGICALLTSLKVVAPPRDMIIFALFKISLIQKSLFIISTFLLAIFCLLKLPIRVIF